MCCAPNTVCTALLRSSGRLRSEIPHSKSFKLLFQILKHQSKRHQVSACVDSDPLDPFHRMLGVSQLWVVAVSSWAVASRQASWRHSSLFSRLAWDNHRVLLRKAHVYHSGVMSDQTSLMDGKPRKSVHSASVVLSFQQWRQSLL